MVRGMCCKGKNQVINTDRNADGWVEVNLQRKWSKSNGRCGGAFEELGDLDFEWPCCYLGHVWMEAAYSAES